MRKFGMEPWNSVEVARNEDEFIQIRSSNGGIIARLWIDVDDREFSDEQRENARRIVACVNACRGLPTDELEQKGLVAAVGAELLELDQQQDELIEALKATLAAMNYGGPVINNMDVVTTADELRSEASRLARKAIAKAKGGTA